MVRARRGEIDTLREVVIESWREPLRKSWPATAMAAYFCQLVEAVVEPHHPEPEIFDLLERALGHLECHAPTVRSLRFFESEIAKMLGISNHPVQAEGALRAAIGPFPSSRTKLLELLAPNDRLISPRQPEVNPE